MMNSAKVSQREAENGNETERDRDSESDARPLTYDLGMLLPDRIFMMPVNLIN
jgi:hypothetical protein